VIYRSFIVCLASLAVGSEAILLHDACTKDARKSKALIALEFNLELVEGKFRRRKEGSAE